MIKNIDTIDLLNNLRLG